MAWMRGVRGAASSRASASGGQLLALFSVSPSAVQVTRFSKLISQPSHGTTRPCCPPQTESINSKESRVRTWHASSTSGLQLTCGVRRHVGRRLLDRRHRRRGGGAAGRQLGALGGGPSGRHQGGARQEARVQRALQLRAAAGAGARLAGSSNLHCSSTGQVLQSGQLAAQGWRAARDGAMMGCSTAAQQGIRRRRGTCISYLTNSSCCPGASSRARQLAGDLKDSCRREVSTTRSRHEYAHERTCAAVPHRSIAVNRARPPSGGECSHPLSIVSGTGSLGPTASSGSRQTTLFMTQHAVAVPDDHPHRPGRPAHKMT